VVGRQIEFVTEQSGSMATVLPAEATLENKGGESDRRSAGAWTESAAWAHFSGFVFSGFDSVRFFREKLAG
jgi:hypothetical protein